MIVQSQGVLVHLLLPQEYLEIARQVGNQPCGHAEASHCHKQLLADGCACDSSKPTHFVPCPCGVLMLPAAVAKVAATGGEYTRFSLSPKQTIATEGQSGSVVSLCMACCVVLAGSVSVGEACGRRASK